MAISKVKKIQLAAVTEHRSNILNILQNFGALQLTDVSEEPVLEKETSAKTSKDIQKLHEIGLDYANVDFAIKMLSPFGEKKSFLAGPLVLTEKEIEEKGQAFNYQEIVEKCLKIEETTAKAKNKLVQLKNDITVYTPWKKLHINIENLKGSQTSEIIAGSISNTLFEETKKSLNELGNLIEVEKISDDGKNTLLTIIFNKNLEKKVKQVLSEYKFAQSEFPEATGLIKDYLESLKKETTENENIIKEEEKKLREIAKDLDNMKIVHDYLGWQKEKYETIKNLENTQYSFVFNAWVPKKKMKKLEEELANTTKEYNITELELKEGELPPVIIQNSTAMGPFETLTRMFGLPRYDEMDPTPYLSAFFIVFFALCLTDAGYGIVMFTIMALMLKYVKMGEGATRLVKLLMYGGIATIIIGALFGGWFGFLPEDMPEWITYTTESGERMFLLQKISAITNPIAVLILALGLGFIQILLGTFMKLFHDYKHNDKKEAILDTGTWAFMLTGIGFFILAAAGVLPGMAEFAKWWVYLATLGLILTQGRDKKNIIGKFVSGVLSLYGLVSYMSDILSYSRLLALGLATAIIALAVNVIVNLFIGIPYVGWILAAVIFVGGHSFNLLINALGSFIHSGRLQFVEFFGKFMEGGGKDFKPFSKKSKYVFIKNN